MGARRGEKTQLGPSPPQPRAPHSVQHQVPAQWGHETAEPTLRADHPEASTPVPFVQSCVLKNPRLNALRHCSSCPPAVPPKHLCPQT